MQKRISSMSWQSRSGLPCFKDESHQKPKPLNASKKNALFFLNPVIQDDHIDLYFVNNTEHELSFVCGYELMATQKHRFGLQVVPSKNPLTDDDWVYEHVKPQQGVKVASQHMVYGSDFLDQFTVYTFIKSPDLHWGLWRFSVVEKANIDKPYPLLWEEFQLPRNVSAEKINKPIKRPILPLVVNARYDRLKQLKQRYSPALADFIMAVHDCIYRHDDAFPVGCYANDLWDEYVCQSEEIAKYIARDDVQLMLLQDVETLITSVFDKWFWQGCLLHKAPLEAVSAEIWQLWMDFHVTVSTH